MAYLKDVSAVLGLSVSAVCKALNGYSDISEETRKKVIKTAEELDYNCGKETGLRPARRTWGAVGVMAPGSAELVKLPHYRELICAIAAEAAGCERDLVIMGEEFAEREMSWIARATLRKVDGICLMANREDLYKGRFAELLGSNIPLVSVGNEVAGHTSICMDLRKSAGMMMQYLKEKGHIRTAFPVGHSAEYQKMAVILKEEARKLDMVCMDINTDGSEFQSAAALSGEDITCVIFSSFHEARIQIHKWNTCGYRVPEFVSAVVLQTDRDEWSIYDEPITCISTAPTELGREAVRRLVHMMKHPGSDTGETIYVCGEIRAGNTVRDLRRRITAGNA